MVNEVLQRVARPISIPVDWNREVFAENSSLLQTTNNK
jgi:hypothetical protein